MGPTQRLLRAYIAVMLLSPVGAAASSDRSAQDLETAGKLFQEGRDLLALRRFDDALLKLRAAHELGRTPVTGFALAQLHLERAELIEARDVWKSVSVMPVMPNESERAALARAEAKRQAEDLIPRIPILKLRLVGFPEASAPEVLLDRVRLSAAALGEAIAVNPGKHEVTVRVLREEEHTEVVYISEGDLKRVDIPFRPRKGQGRDPKPKEPRPTLMITGFTVAGAGLVVGSIAGLLALSRRSTLNEICTNRQCGPDAHDDLAAGRSYGNISSVAFGVAGVGVVLGIIGLAIRPQASAPSRAPSGFSISPYGVGFHGHF